MCAPIRFTNLRRNEVTFKASADDAYTVMKRGKGPLYKVVSSEGKTRQQRAALLLRDVRYVIEAHFDMTDRAAEGDSPGKFQDIAKRRIRRGQFYHQPCFGCREFPAQFRWCGELPPCPDELKGRTQDLGWMLYDMDYTDPENIRPLFFRGSLQNGVLNVPPRNGGEVRG